MIVQHHHLGTTELWATAAAGLIYCLVANIYSGIEVSGFTGEAKSEVFRALALSRCSSLAMGSQSMGLPPASPTADRFAVAFGVGHAQ